jgi:hypothetical protein
MRFIIVDSETSDPEDTLAEGSSPPGRRHATALAAHLASQGDLKYGPAPRDYYGWEFVVSLSGVSLVFVLQEHAENQWLVPFEATLFSRCLKPARAKAAVQEVEVMLAGWHFGSLPARCRVLSEQEFDSLATSALPRTAV